jgi:hypothetical protein
MQEVDIWRTAAFLLREHGGGATFNAAQRADALYDKGDLDGFIVWRKVIRAIEQLERQRPSAGEALN